MHNRTSSSIAISAVALALSAGVAAQTPATAPRSPAPTANAPATAAPARNEDAREEARDAAKHLDKALAMVRKMERDPKLTTLLKQAKGVFLVPDYGRAALGVGGQGGAGVLLVHRGGKWTGPAFYNMGGISIGVQAGVEAGEIAMLLMNDKAVNSFAKNNKFALNADAGLTIVNYSAKGQGTAGRGDVVMWSDTEGLLGSAAVGVTDVNFDEEETRAYYGKPVQAQGIIGGTVTTAKASDLLRAMPM